MRWCNSGPEKFPSRAKTSEALLPKMPGKLRGSGPTAVILSVHLHVPHSTGLDNQPQDTLPLQGEGRQARERRRGVPPRSPLRRGRLVDPSRGRDAPGGWGCRDAGAGNPGAIRR